MEETIDILREIVLNLGYITPNMLETEENQTNDNVVQINEHRFDLGFIDQQMRENNITALITFEQNEDNLLSISVAIELQDNNNDNRIDDIVNAILNRFDLPFRAETKNPRLDFPYRIITLSNQEIQ